MKRTLLLLITLLITTLSYGQYRSGGGSFTDKVYFGGGFGLSIGTDMTNISASPLVGYKITDAFSAGLRLNYQYVSQKNPDISLNYYGLGPFARYLVTDEYFLHAEYEYLNFEWFSGVDDRGELETTRDNYDALWLGAGYREGVGRSAGFFVLALYNVLYDPNESPQPYASPLSFQAGFAVGF